jgi:hypothetical protein
MSAPDANEVYEGVEAVRNKIVTVIQALEADDPVEARRLAWSALSSANITLSMFDDDDDDDD